MPADDTAPLAARSGPRSSDYGAIAPDVARARATAAAAAGHMRHLSHTMYSRQRRRTMRAAAGPDAKGDFVIHDFVNEKTRSHILRAEREREDGGAPAWFRYNGQIYLILVALGLGAGAIAAGLDIVVDWLTDVKFGSCSSGWFVSRELCCHTAESFETCGAWVTWSERLGEVAGRAGVAVSVPASGAVIDFAAFMVWAVLFAAIAAFLVKRYAPYAAGSGVPEIKTVLSGVELKGYLSLWAMVVKIIGLAFAVSSGLNLGKEGPFVHLVSALASVLGNCFHAISVDFNVMQELITSGTAAGVAVAFNAPIGGVLFAFEEAAMFFPNHVLWRSFLASAIAALTLKVLNPFFNGRAVIFEIDHGLDWNWFEMLPFAFIGVVGGIIGVIFIQFNVLWTKYRLHNDRIKRSPVLEAVAVVILTTLMSYFFDFYKLSNTEILATLFSECSNLTDKEVHRAAAICDTNSARLQWKMYGILFYGAVSKLFLTILTFGLRVPAGLFIPSMTIGACVGRIVGQIVRFAYERYPTWSVFSECTSSSVCVRPSIYALVGAGSSLAGVTQVSVSLVVIMFELTGGLSHLLPTMVGILSAKLVCAVLGFDEGIYDNHINLKKYPYLWHCHDGHVTHTARTDTIMREPSAVLTTMGCTVGEIRRVLRDNPFYGFPIVRTRQDMILTGNIVRSELRRALKDEVDSNPQVSSSTPVIFNGKLDPDEARYLEKLERENNGLVLKFSNYRDRYLSQVTPETPISDVNYCFSELGVRMCFVTRHGKLLGVVSKKDCIAYNDVHHSVDKHFFRV